MTCKDCLHYEACKAMYLAEWTMPNDEDFDNEHFADVYNCSDFTDRSEWVHLPCKVGDTVFCLYDRDYGEYKVVTMNIDPLGKLKIRVECNIHGYEKIEDCPEEFCGQPFCVGCLGADDFGKTVFLTREEAEKALEGMKSE